MLGKRSDHNTDVKYEVAGTCNCIYMYIYENVEDQLMRGFFEFCIGTLLTNGKLFYNFLIFSTDSYELKLRCLTLACSYSKEI